MRHPSKPHANHQAADALATPDPAATSASAAPTETTLATFDDTDGEYPVGELVLDSSGDLFGVKSEGGSSNDGTVFEVKASSGQITDLHSFTAANGDGDFPYASLSMDGSGGKLYGTTEYGGASGEGTVFELSSRSSGAYKTIAQVGSNTGDGRYPGSGVYVAPDGAITGTTRSGGANNTGTVFTIAPDGSTPAYTSLPAANGSNTYYGPLPLSAPIEIGMSLYSTTYGDGSTTNPGAIFAFSTQKSTIETLATFNSATGYSPQSGVVADSAGNLYGTTRQGAGSGYGSIYEYNPTTGTIQVLASFNSATGYASDGNLLRDGAGDLFGTTFAGGADGDGTVFELKAGSPTINVLYNFTGGTDGAHPEGGLVADAMGNLYGTTANAGTVYEIQNAGFVPVCFAAGTRIRTARGDIAVEALAVGDLVVTASGATRPVRWLGHRTVDCRRHLKPRETMPIRIAAHAFGEKRPARDLFLSPGHSVCVDLFGEVLIPVGRLANGATIAQLDVDEVTYWHVELDAHDIVLAEDLPCESYIDCGTRAFFAESDVVDLAALPDALVLTTDDYCRPFHPEGALVDFAERLCLRADDLGWRLEVADPLGGLWLEVDGRRVVPHCDGLVARITVQAAVREIFLCSDCAVPADIHGARDEQRLGLQLASLVADDGLHWRCEMACTDERLVDGFHPHEGMHRWTDGRTRLPAELWAGTRDMFVLRLAFAGPALPRWVAPANVASREAETAAA